MSRLLAVFLSIILLSSVLVGSSYGFLGGDLPQQNSAISNKLKIEHSSQIVKIEPISDNDQPTVKRYLIFGSGSISGVKSVKNNIINSINTNEGFFSVGTLSENEATKLKASGYHIAEDFLLDFHSTDETESTEEIPDISRISDIAKSKEAFEKYGYTGAGVNIAIVDTGVDFSNPDIMDSLARDENNHPIMLDADGQGIVLTNATFVANINKNGIIRNYTETLPENATSSVYITRDGVFLNMNQKGDGTIIPIYNSFFPQVGPTPIFNGTIADDMKIQVVFNTALSKGYRLIGYDNRILENDEFDDDTVDAGDLGAGQSITAFYELIPVSSSENLDEIDDDQYEFIDYSDVTSLATVRVRYKEIGEDESKLVENIVLESSITDTPSTNFLFASSVIEVTNILIDSQYKGDSELISALDRLENNLGVDFRGYRFEFLGLLEQLIVLQQ